MDGLIKAPVRYEKRGTYIFDAEHNMVANVRGWGRISYMDNPEEKQDSMGRFIADAINEKMVDKKSERQLYYECPVCGDHYPVERNGCYLCDHADSTK